MTSARTTCGAKGSVNRYGKPCGSVFISKETGLCRSHDPSQVNRVQETRSQGGRQTRRRRLSKRMTRLVAMLFNDREAAPTIDRIDPGENDPSNYEHLMVIEGQRAVLDGYGPRGFHCANHYRCMDQSMFARAMRLLRIYERGDEYVHVDTGTIIPREEIAKVTRLVRER